MKQCAEKFVALLDEREFHYSAHVDNDGDDIIDFPYDGKVVKIIFTGEKSEYASLYMQYESVPDDKRVKLIEVCNELNCRFKWVTFFVDAQNDLMLHVDALLGLETAADEAFEMLARMLNISNEAKNEIMKAIYA